MTAASPASIDSRPEDKPRRRPFGVVVLALLFPVRAAFLLIALAIPSLPDVGFLARLVELPFEIAKAVQDNPVAGWTIVAFAVLLVAAAVLMWFRRRTGWRIAILTTGLFLLIDLVLLIGYGQVFPLWMTLDVIVVFYLNQREVREWFQVATDTARTAEAT